MQVLFTTLRNASHFLPLIPFISACRRRGHEVAVAAPPDVAERVAATGASFFPFGHPGDEGLGPLWGRLRGASEEESMRISIGEIFAGACAGAALPGLLETISRWRPSIIIRESQEYAGLIAAQKVQIAHARVAISAPSGEAQMVPYAAAPVDLHGRAAGLPPDSSGERLIRETALTLFPASLELEAEAAAPVLRFRATRKEAPPLPQWWGARQGPFVYVTLGTVVGGFDMMRSTYRTVLDAVADLPIRVLLTVGADLPLDALGEVPPHVHVERFLPQDDVIPHAAAVICHGGSGTVLGTLAAGVPMVVAPLFADQPFNAARVAATGAGIALPTRGTSAAAVREALSQVLADGSAQGSFGQAARKIAKEISELPSIDDAPLEIERLARLPLNAGKNLADRG
ncbi:MAG: glycosyltransferase family 1 protein [Deltaproteobacteria bacterium]|nr:glycosyltransferase family 1 protein [Deltaproteobacteria bacterium]